MRRSLYPKATFSSALTRRFGASPSLEDLERSDGKLSAKLFRLRPAHLRHHALELAHFFHHLLHLVEPVQQCVQLRDTDAAAFGDSLAPARVENLWVAPFPRRHCANHAFHPFEFLLALAQVGVLQ